MSRRCVFLSPDPIASWNFPSGRRCAFHARASRTYSDNAASVRALSVASASAWPDSMLSNAPCVAMTCAMSSSSARTGVALIASTSSSMLRGVRPLLALRLEVEVLEVIVTIPSRIHNVGNAIRWRGARGPTAHARNSLPTTLIIGPFSPYVKPHGMGTRRPPAFTMLGMPPHLPAIGRQGGAGVSVAVTGSVCRFPTHSVATRCYSVATRWPFGGHSVATTSILLLQDG